MKRSTSFEKPVWRTELASVILAGLPGLLLAGCGEGDPGPPGGSGGGSGTSSTSGAGDSATAGQASGGQPATGGSAGQSGSVGVSGSGGTAGMGGAGGSAGGVGKAGMSGEGGSSAGAAGAAGTSGAGGSAGSEPASGGSAGMPSSGGTCTAGPWPEADPAAAGPFATITETNVGPAVGEGEEGEPPVAFTLFRPMDLDESGLCHPVVTWGNGTSSSPDLYGVFLRHLASHGFVVIASDSPNVARGDPQPMVAGVSWVIEQNDDPASPLYRRIDTAHVGATGHSQGGLATTNAGGDSQVTTIAPLCGAGQQRNLHGPAFLFCGGEDTIATCENIQNSFEASTGQPAMFANYLSADHANWITFRGTMPSPVEVTVTAWMRVQLMGDTTLRSWFYGPSCELCLDPAWEVLQKSMDQ